MIQQSTRSWTIMDIIVEMLNPSQMVKLQLNYNITMTSNIYNLYIKNKLIIKFLK